MKPLQVRSMTKAADDAIWPSVTIAVRQCIADTLWRHLLPLRHIIIDEGRL